MVHRRTLLAASLAAPPLARAASAQTGAADGYPSRPVAVLTGYTPGGVTDTAARAVAERMQRELGQPVVVENRPGAATAVANTAVAQARPDGYTLLMGTSTLAINPALQPTLTPREPMRELVPVGMVFRTAFVLHVHPSVPAKNTAEFIAHAKANPGQVNFGSSGTGAVNHLCQALFAQRAGIEVTHVPFRGGAPALLELRQGRIQAMFQAVQEALPVLREGTTRGLGISSAERSPLLPEVPPVADTLPGFDVVFWQGLFAPVGTPEPVLARVGAALRAATDDPALRARMAEQGVSVQTGDAAMLRDLLARETESWGKLIREAGIKPD
ncbi:tripartite tricarboxylate transporter substrate binding protein [Craurococcus roseus]|uniref:Tripartite tricarboxylate transporter substrate binding protein n=1 Tax=Craurococcus roseus TaxID=77585 RepID=A0ABP3PNS1_9PROT